MAHQMQMAAQKKGGRKLPRERKVRRTAVSKRALRCQTK